MNGIDPAVVLAKERTDYRARDAAINKAVFPGISAVRLLELPPKLPLVGDVQHWIRFDGDITEIYDLCFLPNVRNPMMVGLRMSEIRGLITFEVKQQRQRGMTESSFSAAF